MIKKFLLVCTIFSAVFLTACLDTEEKIVINKNNSGDYTLTLDMSKMLAMMDQFGGQDSTKEKEKKDSTVFFKPYIDTSAALSAREKALFRDGSIRMQVDEAEKEMKVIIHFPFKNISDLPEMKSSYLSVIDKLGISNKLGKNDSSAIEQADADLSKNKNMLNPAEQAFAFAAAPGKISNTLVNKQLITDKLQNDSTMQMLQQMSLMMGDMTYKTIIILPKPAKKYNGKEVQASADKKTLTFTTSLTDMLNRPEAAEYKVEY
ncbi:MAG: hypothetical protein J0H29_19970 [Sphingobacteriales bacterium]|nr:hypothetical protein [Sphingobacteriales bacterium]OJY81104.1 MAG: hypothetical protein BGP14_07755 [Sphingobacteriales bacterium 44-15]